MIRTDDLQIGDWVRPLKKKLKGTPGKVITIDGGTGICWIDSKDYSCLVPCSDVERIPITPEILEKNGFIKDKENEYSITYHILIPTGYKKNSYTIQITFYKVPFAGVNVLFKCWGWLPPNNSGMNDIHMCNVEHVHQLQHALKLCGIEKEIQI